MKYLAIALMLISTAWIAFRVLMNPTNHSSFQTQKEYEVTYLFYPSGDSMNYSVSTFIPTNNRRQEINTVPSNDGQVYFDGFNKKMNWKSFVSSSDTISYSFTVRAKEINFNINEYYDGRVDLNGGSDLSVYLESTSYIESENSKIQDIALDIELTSNTLSEAIQQSFDFVYQIPSTQTGELTTALQTLDQYEASCNGKSRLLTALLRAQQIPSRMVGGLILEEGKKKTSHAWVEAYIAGYWIPFDALNGHFAKIPENYLEIYKGDEFLITRSSNIDFDYMYEIKESRLNSYPNFAIFNLWDLIDGDQIPIKQLSILILLPLGALVVGISKNVIGFKTFGVFLPVLIAFAFHEMGALIGLIFFASVIAIISIINSPLDKFGLLNTPKVGVMLTVVVIYCLFVMKLYAVTGWTKPASALLFPIIILTITSERFARKVEEESLKDAITIFAQTLCVTFICLLVISSELIQNFLITFPEFLVFVAGVHLLLGKWIGIRVSEHFRFKSQQHEEVYYA